MVCVYILLNGVFNKKNPNTYLLFYWLKFRYYRYPEKGILRIQRSAQQYIQVHKHVLNGHIYTQYLMDNK